jgi:hypothetical protein
MATKDDITLEGWPRGITNLGKPLSTPDGFLRDALNVDLDNAGKPRRREGRQRVYQGARTHSLHSGACGPVFVEGSVLKKLLPDHTAVDIADLSGSNDRVSYEEVNGLTYLTNDREVWVLDSNANLRLNGVHSPMGQPLLSTSTMGSLEPGGYLVAVTFVDAYGRSQELLLLQKLG